MAKTSINNIEKAMSGGGSDDPAVFNEAMYNFQRIRLAPTLVIIGLAIEIYAILLNPS